MRSFDKANCRQGVASSALAPFGLRSGLRSGISGNNSIRCAHDRTQSRLSQFLVPFLLSSSSILVCVFRSSRAGRSEGFIEWRGKGQAARILSTSSHRIVVRTKLNFSASVRNDSKTPWWYLRIEIKVLRENFWPKVVTTEQPRPGRPWPWYRYGENTINPPGPRAGQCFTLLTDTRCQPRPCRVFLQPF